MHYNANSHIFIYGQKSKPIVVVSASVLPFEWFSVCAAFFTLLLLPSLFAAYFSFRFGALLRCRFILLLRFVRGAHNAAGNLRRITMLLTPDEGEVDWSEAREKIRNVFMFVDWMQHAALRPHEHWIEMKRRMQKQRLKNRFVGMKNVIYTLTCCVATIHYFVFFHFFLFIMPSCVLPYFALVAAKEPGSVTLLLATAIPGHFS